MGFFWGRTWQDVIKVYFLRRILRVIEIDNQNMNTKNVDVNIDNFLIATTKSCRCTKPEISNFLYTLLTKFKKIWLLDQFYFFIFYFFWGGGGVFNILTNQST